MGFSKIIGFMRLCRDVIPTMENEMEKSLDNEAGVGSSNKWGVSEN